MKRHRLFLLKLLALVAFAGNSLLCRLALKDTAIDPATFTAMRIVSGAVTLVADRALARRRRAPRRQLGLGAGALRLCRGVLLLVRQPHRRDRRPGLGR